MMTSIRVETLQGFEFVEPLEVSRSGRLALHRMVGSEFGLTITHIATGWSLGGTFYDNVYRLKFVLAEMDELDWDFDRPCQLSPQTHARALDIARRARMSSPDGDGLSDEFRARCFAEPTRAVPAPEQSGGGE